MKKCKDCNGTGDCRFCDGTGETKINLHPSPQYVNGKGEGTSRCCVCEGSGKCIECNGTGYTPQK